MSDVVVADEYEAPVENPNPADETDPREVVEAEDLNPPMERPDFPELDPRVVIDPSDAGPSESIGTDENAAPDLEPAPDPAPGVEPIDAAEFEVDNDGEDVVVSPPGWSQPPQE